MEAMKSLFIFLIWHTRAHKPYLWGHRSCLSRQCWMQAANFSNRIVNETHPRDHIMKKPRENPYTWLHHIMSLTYRWQQFCISLSSVHCNYPIIRNKVPNVLFLSTFLVLQLDVRMHLWNIFFNFSFFHTELIFLHLLTLTSLAVMLTRLGALHS